MIVYHCFPVDSAMEAYELRAVPNDTVFFARNLFGVVGFEAVQSDAAT